MKVVCGHCRTGYSIDTSRMKNPFIKVRCSRCKYVFTVYNGSTDPGHDSNDAVDAAVRSGQIDDPEIAAESGDRQDVSPKGSGRIIAVSNQKGGVAKTTTCLNLGVSLAMMGKKVLLIDFDTQANLSLCLGYQNTASFFDLLHHSRDETAALILQTRYKNLWLLLSNQKLVLLDKKYFGAPNFENILRDRLALVAGDYDYILIDTPPSVGFFTLNALTAAHVAVVPCLCEYLSTHGTNQTLDVIRMIQAKTNPSLDYRILVTKYDEADTAAQVIYAKLMENFDDRTYKTVIDYDVKMKEAQIMKLPAIIYDNECPSGTGYVQLAREILDGASTQMAASA